MKASKKGLLIFNKLISIIYIHQTNIYIVVMYCNVFVIDTSDKHLKNVVKLNLRKDEYIK